MIRSSDVLPEPEGPSSASSSPVSTCRSTLSTATKMPKRLAMPRSSMLMRESPATCRRRAARAARRANFAASVTSASSASSDAHGERGGELVFVVEDLDVQRQRVGRAADVPGDHGHRAELAHRARVAQDHAVQQAPLDVGQRDRARTSASRPRRGTRRGFLLLRALRLHQRDQLARDERKRHERSSRARCPARAKMIFRSCSRSHGPNQSLQRRRSARRSGRR